MNILIPCKRAIDYNVNVTVKADESGVEDNVKMSLNPFDEIALEEACRLARRDTRRFARRQIAWFRNQLVPTLSLSTQYSQSLNLEIFPLISEFLLTTDP